MEVETQDLSKRGEIDRNLSLAAHSSSLSISIMNSKKVFLQLKFPEIKLISDYSVIFSLYLISFHVKDKVLKKN